MPQRKNKNTLLINKQKKLIENRLIQISMIVDDYIYHSKPLSSTNAELYMREVYSYKDRCFGDIRSLQVIEKLIRFMKGIIIEQGHKGINLDDLNNLPTTPIYSVLDDLAQSTHDPKLSAPKVKKSVTNVRKYVNKNKKINVINTRGNFKKAKKTVISEGSDIVDLCIDNDEEIHPNNAVGNQNVKNIADNSASLQDLSYHSIKNFGDILTPNVVTEECSQSILSGFHELPEPIYPYNNKNPIVKATCLKPTAQMRNTQTIADEQTVLAQEIYANNNKATIKPKIQKFKAVINNEIEHIQEIYNDKDKTINSISNEYNPNTKQIINKLSQNNIKTSESKANTTKKLNQRQKATKQPKTKEAKVRKPRSTKQNNVITVENSRNYQNKLDKEKVSNPITVEKTRNNRIKEDNEKTLILEDSSNNQNKIDKKESKTTSKRTKIASQATINNNMIENDLSWLENIKYVREIAKDEYVTTTLRDHFWENCSLPDNWNTDDFLY